MKTAKIAQKLTAAKLRYTVKNLGDNVTSFDFDVTCDLMQPVSVVAFDNSTFGMIGSKRVAVAEAINMAKATCKRV